MWHRRERASNLPFVLLCWGMLAAQFLLSDVLYQARPCPCNMRCTV